MATSNTTRPIRALTSVVAVEPHAPGLVNVTTWSDEYLVDLHGDGCMCPDKEYNEPLHCKHEYAAMLAQADDKPTPYITETRQRAATDGGNPRPDDCECWGQNDLACFACFREGFETPADVEGGA